MTSTSMSPTTTSQCTTDNCVVTQVINDRTTSFTFTGTTATTINVPCSSSPCPTPSSTTTTSTMTTTSTTTPSPTPTIDLECLCQDTGSYCGRAWPEKCMYGKDTVHHCPDVNMKAPEKDICKPERCFQEGRVARCLVDCEVQIQYGIGGGEDDGAVFIQDVQKFNEYSMLYDADGTGSTWGIAVNRNMTEMKANEGSVYMGNNASYWTKVSALSQTTTLSAYASRQDGSFVYASINRGGNVWYHPDPPTGKPLTAKYTNLAGNAVTFCSSPMNCILDLAFDGNDYAWMISAYGDLYISTTKQDVVLGGSVKYIGKINYPGGNVWGIAFDVFGTVYYAGHDSTVGWSYKARMSDPLNSVPYNADKLRNYADMASCAYPKVNLTSLIGR
ncbi:hypothetical protein BG004_001693 [Podila humilis]|nr:hypothetical protein BG004_001693 [Podila humilis]